MSRKRKANDSGEQVAADDQSPAKATKSDTAAIWTETKKRAGEKFAPLLYMYAPKDTGRTKVASFDIDWTLIKTKSGQQFSKNADDWDWLFPGVPEKLRALDKQGFRVVFFTNQGGIEKGKTKVDDVKGKVNGIARSLNIPVCAFVSTGENQFRKPSNAVWDFFAQNCNGGVKLDLAQCFFVGDAAGRAKDWAPGKKKDFSVSDRKFAANIGIAFHTPEEYFLSAKQVKFEWGTIDPQTILKQPPKTAVEYHKKAPPAEMVILVGLPACGKSTFARRYFVPHGYVHVNRDTLKTPARCVKETEEALEAKKSVVVDNTNPSKSARAEYVKIAKKFGVAVRCFVLTTPEPVAHHLNFVRQNHTDGEVRRIPDVGYNVYKKNYEEPNGSEGFSEVRKVEFVTNFEGDAKLERLFKEWT